jgi:hypothetical protein
MDHSFSSLAMLVNWEIWSEQNARVVFRMNASTAMMVIAKIKEEATALKSCQG